MEFTGLELCTGARISMPSSEMLLKRAFGTLLVLYFGLLLGCFSMICMDLETLDSGCSSSDFVGLLGDF